jgi:hypothetical protein
MCHQDARSPMDYFFLDMKEQKEEKECNRLTVGGDKIVYRGDKSTRTAGLTKSKILINSTVSTKGARFLVIEINKFHFNNPLNRYEYMIINLSSLPQEFIDE